MNKTKLSIFPVDEDIPGRGARWKRFYALIYVHSCLDSVWDLNLGFFPICYQNISSNYSLI